MTNQFKKGNKVFIIRRWNDEGAYYIVNAEVKSYGKKQATMYEEDSGEMAHEVFYVSLINKNYQTTTVLNRNDYTEEEAISCALNLSEEYLTETEKEYRRRYAQAMNESYEDYSPTYGESMLEIAEKAKNGTPSYLWYRDTEYCSKG